MKNAALVLKKIFLCLYIALIIILSADIIIGANGRYFEFNILSFAISPRMIIFSIVLLFFSIRFLFKNKKQKKAFFTNPVILLFLTIFFVSIISFGFGFVTNGLANAFSDLKTFLMMLIVFPYFDIWQEGYLNAKRSYLFFKICSIILTFVVLVAQIIMIKWGIDNGYNYDRIAHDLNIYFMNNYPNFAIGFRRPYGIYYDGLFFVSIAFSCIFAEVLFLKKSKFNKALSILLMVLMGYVVLQSQTRGFLIVMFITCLATIIAKVVLYLKEKKKANKTIKFDLIYIGIIASLFFGTFIIMFYTIFKNTRLFDFDDASTQVRLTFIRECLEIMFKPSILIGKGLGFQIESKGTVHLEISLLEIFLKQGLIGLIVWITPLILFVFYLNRRKLETHFKILTIMFMSFVYGVSFFNPHLFDIAGVSLLFMALMILSDTSFLKFRQPDLSEINICTLFLNSDKEKYRKISQSIYFYSGELEICKFERLLIFFKEQKYTHVFLVSNPDLDVLNLLKLDIEDVDRTYYFKNKNAEIFCANIEHLLMVLKHFNFKVSSIKNPSDLMYCIPSENIEVIKKDSLTENDNFLSSNHADLYIKYTLFYSFLNFFKIINKRSKILNNNRDKKVNTGAKKNRSSSIGCDFIFDVSYIELEL